MAAFQGCQSPERGATQKQTPVCDLVTSTSPAKGIISFAALPRPFEFPAYADTEVPPPAGLRLDAAFGQRLYPLLGPRSQTSWLPWTLLQGG